LWSDLHPIKILTPQRKSGQEVLWLKPSLFGEIYAIPALLLSNLRLQLRINSCKQYNSRLL